MNQPKIPEFNFDVNPDPQKDTKVVQEQKGQTEAEKKAEDQFIIKTFDELDIKAIQSIIRGEAKKPAFNLFETKERGIIWRLSYVGVIELIAILKDYHLIGNPISDHTPLEYSFIVHARNVMLNIDDCGVGSCPKSFDYARQTALSLAVRNAYYYLIPEDDKVNFFYEWYEKWYEKKYEGGDANIV